MVSDNFETCQKVPIVAIPLNSSVTDVGQGPYTMIAFPPGGVPTMQEIGSDPNNLTWTVDQPAGESLTAPYTSLVISRQVYGRPLLNHYLIQASSSC